MKENRRVGNTPRRVRWEMRVDKGPLSMQALMTNDYVEADREAAVSPC